MGIMTELQLRKLKFVWSGFYVTHQQHEHTSWAGKHIFKPIALNGVKRKQK